MPSHVSADKFSPVNIDRFEPDDDGAGCVDWSSYATAYDLLSQHNPAYQALLHDFEGFLSAIKSPEVIYDIGGGTGNYTKIAARVCPCSEIRFIEPNAGMMNFARSKLAAHGNITYDTLALEDIDDQSEADLIICVHALYAMPAREQRLADMLRLLRPGGLLYLIDLGRYMNVADWRRYLFSHLRKEHGFARTLQLFWRGREIAKQNKAILKAQKNGVYRTHTKEEIASAATAVGFEILRQESVYRGYSDLLVCRAKS